MHHPISCFYRGSALIFAFFRGFENAVLQGSGQCSCGDLSFTGINSEPVSKSKCTVPCYLDKTVSCGGNGKALVYQKPQRCRNGYLNQHIKKFYCAHLNKRNYYDAVSRCSTVSNTEVLHNLIIERTFFNFLKVGLYVVCIIDL